MRTNGLVSFGRECLPCGLLHRWAPVSELERKVLSGHCVKVRIRKTHAYKYVLVDDPIPSLSKDSPTGIPCREMAANVGIGSKAQVARARQKVMGYGEITWRPSASVYVRLQRSLT